jgi:hypothetical protein
MYYAAPASRKLPRLNCADIYTPDYASRPTYTTLDTKNGGFRLGRQRRQSPDRVLAGRRIATPR